MCFGREATVALAKGVVPWPGLAIGLSHTVILVCCENDN